jgi:steroid 5-alpha reductase family enzyme
VTFAAFCGLALIAEGALAAIMAGAWAAQRLTAQSGWIDAIWTFGVSATGVALAPGGLAAWQTSAWRAAAVAIAAGIWSVRLGLHIVARTRRASDDPRYRKLIDGWGPSAASQLFLFLQAQALVGAALAVAVALAAAQPSLKLRLQDIIGLAIFVIALVGEATADAQLTRFRADPAHRGQICDVGLWARSRHPNYFFEWLTWVAFAVVATDFGIGAVARIAPALMYWILRYVSGVPPIEERMLLTRAEAFGAYRKRTPIFFPRLF